MTVSSHPARAAGACSRWRPSRTWPPEHPARSALHSAFPCNGTYTLTARGDHGRTTRSSPAESATARPARSTSSRRPRPSPGRRPRQRGSSPLGCGTTCAPGSGRPGYIIERQHRRRPVRAARSRSARASSTWRTDGLPDEGGDATYRVTSTRPSPGGTRHLAVRRRRGDDLRPRPHHHADGLVRRRRSDGSGSRATGPRRAPTRRHPTTGAGNGSGGQGPGTTRRRRACELTGERTPTVFAGTFLPPLLRPADETIEAPPRPPPTPGSTSRSPSNVASQVTRTRSFRPTPWRRSSRTARSGAGMVIPVATALVLALWAVHLRMLARAARPVD